jgi:hypothetical protein
VLGLSGCDAYTNSIATKAKEILQSNLNTDAKFSKYKMRVTSVKLVGEGLMKFEGIAQVELDDTSHDVPISVSSDFSNILVQTKPGAFVFLLEKEMGELSKELNAAAEKASKEIEDKIMASQKSVNELGESNKDSDKNTGEAIEKPEKDIDEASKELANKLEELKRSLR